MLAALTYYIFKKNARQKIRERQADWFHKLVLDGAVTKLTEFVETSCNDLKASAKGLRDLKATDPVRGEIDEYTTKTLRDFKDRLRRIQRYVCAQTCIFDKGVEQKIADRFMRLEDDVTAWFAREAEAEADEARAPLAELAVECGSDVVNSLIEFEFSRWG